MKYSLIDFLNSAQREAQIKCRHLSIITAHYLSPSRLMCFPRWLYSIPSQSLKYLPIFAEFSMTLAPVQATQASQFLIPRTGDDNMVDVGACELRLSLTLGVRNNIVTNLGKTSHKGSIASSECHIGANHNLWGHIKNTVCLKVENLNKN